VRFDRLGVFTYSEEDGTNAAKKYKDNIPNRKKKERADEIMAIQQQISLELNHAKIGKSYHTIIDKETDEYYIGRTEFDSPEVDNEVLIKKDKPLVIGNFYQVKITGAEEFDLFAQLE
jgi:ribosomal protein S12 methylthiotransferase